MTAENKIIKVQKIGLVGIFLIMPAIFPIFFVLLSFVFSFNYLLTALVSFVVYGIGIYLTIKRIIKNEAIYEIIADQNTISIRNSKTYTWDEIQTIDTYKDYSLHFFKYRRSRIYIRFLLIKNESFVLDATDYDIWYEDLQKELLSLKNSAKPEYIHENNHS